jgi:hypothetical protein
MLTHVPVLLYLNLLKDFARWGHVLFKLIMWVIVYISTQPQFILLQPNQVNIILDGTKYFLGDQVARHCLFPINKSLTCGPA